MTCPSCGTENASGKRFCIECGTALALACPTCGAALAGGEKFCGECGTALSAEAPVAPVAPVAAAPTAERRLVSVLFADLVGFTTASEGRDAEETRDLLSRYFETARTLIERYGGTVEKFIGDAVMAVWGAPSAREDDAERAVRAALDLVAAVPELDASLQARAGVLTGEAAVSLGVEGQGMVAGDLVNTASRIQTTAEPGTVLVGDATKRASEAAVAYEDAGEHPLKGKAEPAHLWRALRVTAARGGALKFEGLEPPFVGRDRELRLIKELFHGSAEEGKAHLVSVTGIAGLGKSRLVWEFHKYLDGLVQDFFYWRGRCLAYGEGVAYWALAEMVRTRADIVEGEDPESARAKLKAGVAEFISDPDEQAWIEPRLAHLLGLEERIAADREDLFAAWRLYFERLSEHQPAVLVFEDTHWADPSLLEFIDYLLEWSRNHPIFVLSVARPELMERHPTWGAGSRSYTAIALEPLSHVAIDRLLDGLVPGLPDDLSSRILERAEGVPLYAVETVRMLLDRGLIAREGDRYRLTGPVEALEVPETLHALVAARLDGLEQDERSLVQDASVLGKTFTKEALSALTGLAEVDLEPLLTSLVRKEVLSIQGDPRSPERGQYGFLQDLLRFVAYETLAKKERKARHLAAAEYLEREWGPAEHEIVEVLASHYLDAYRAAPDAPDAVAIKAKAHEALARAGERAASLAASEEAQRYFEQAADLAGDTAAEAALRERAGRMAYIGGRNEQARTAYERALAIHEEAGEINAAARVSARLGEAEWESGLLGQALERMERSFSVLATEEPDPDVAELAAMLARLHYFEGDRGRASEQIEVALGMAETLRLPEQLSQALNTKALILLGAGRPEEGLALIRHALELALDNDLADAALRGYFNLSYLLAQRERWDELTEPLERGLALARTRGERAAEWRALGNLIDTLQYAGEWDMAMARAAEFPAEALDVPQVALNIINPLTRIHTSRGDLAAARSLVDEQRSSWGDARTADQQLRASSLLAEAVVRRAEERYDEALAAAEEDIRLQRALGNALGVMEAVVEAVEAALQLGRSETAAELLALVDDLGPGEDSQSLRAQRRRLGARIAATAGEHDKAEQGFKRAVGAFRELAMPFWLAVTLLEYGEWLVTVARAAEAEPLLAEASEIFERLGAKPWLERSRPRPAGGGGRMICSSCGTENRPGRKFCSKCGTALATACPSCGAPNEVGDAFCGECGTPLTGAAPAPVVAAAPPAAERRLVSVLFADLVGFTTASEGRDAEETRELLSRYFETARTLIERYGGTVEKFIGDAVMAVWGTPVAQEDDAERAVRTALDLVAAVPELDGGLQARAGVLTGEAAVTVGAEGQGMVAGDLVNTASRIQSAAEPGTVLVGSSTRRASEAAIAYEDAGEHTLKGKAEPEPLWRALRVTAGRAGALKSARLEPPFVGRDRELRLLKELFHASAEEQRAHLISVVGVAGIGKSRLGWEFYKYIDGLSETVWWHRGRCLAYGDGVAYWALAEMVRMRAGIAEGEDRASALAKLRSTLEEYVPDDEERRFVEPRLAHLLGLEDATARGKDELFGAWRVLFERLAEAGPVVLLFEDLQWADASLVEFVSYLLEWARSRPIFVLCLARPDLAERHPELGHGSRQTALSLEPLSALAMEQLLDGFVPGLPPELKGRILARAEGVPLYAVETVRMLLDRGLLTEEGGVYRTTGAVEELDVPETLQGLISARLDGLAADERRLLQDAAVLGKTFTREALAALSGLPEAELEPLLGSLVRKEVLGVQADPRSPERGQYGFLQDLVRRVAYDTLARRERRSRHLAAAAQLEATFGTAEQEIVEVVASHYVAAYEAQPDAEDAGKIKEQARELLARAGERAGSLAAADEARRYYEQAAELSDDPVVRALLLERAGHMAQTNAEHAVAKPLYASSLELFEAAGETHAAARVSGRLASAEYQTGDIEGATDRLQAAFRSVAGDEPDADVAEIAARLSTMLVFAGDLDGAREPNDLALRLAQEQRLPETLCRAMLARGVAAIGTGRPEEALALMRHALRHALENDITEHAGIAYGNLADVCFSLDRYGEAFEHIEEALALARRAGQRRNELFMLSESSYALTMLGRWDEALAFFEELPDGAHTLSNLMSPLTGVLEIQLHRGQSDDAEALFASFGREGSSELQTRACTAGARAALAWVAGRHREALDAGMDAAALADGLGWGQQAVKQGLVWAVEAALALDDETRADELLGRVESLPPGLRPPFLEAQAHRFRARMGGDETGFKTAAGGFREYGFPFWLAVTELEHGEWLTANGRSDEAAPLLAEAREIFERLEAAPWLERLGGVDTQAGVAA